jgi:hypothetical protein
VLEPESRQLLVDALRPPEGYTLDRAVGTTYSLDLMSLLVAPLAFALFDREAADGRLIADPIALLEAVRRHADRIDVFCQAGQIAIPREHRHLFTYLEPSVHEVGLRNKDAIFHPKVWAIRYRSLDGAATYRVLTLSRNLTFDRSWDTVLQLNGEAQQRASGDKGLSHFLDHLPNLAVREIAENRAASIKELADELRDVVFEPPEGFDRLAFRPIGLGPESWPFVGRIDRMLVVSPFLTAGCIERLGREGVHHVVVSRPEAFDLLGAQAFRRTPETLVLSPSAHQPMLEPENGKLGNEAPTTVDEAIAEGCGAELSGLHAKLFVAEEPWRARVWTGSANATDAAFGGNVELLVELEGPKGRCGIDAILGDPRGGVGLRKLLEPYSPAGDNPRELTDKELLDRRVDELRRIVARQTFLARADEIDPEKYALLLEMSPARNMDPGTLAQQFGTATVRVRPLTLESAWYRTIVLNGTTAVADFGTVSFAALTSFFAVEIEALEGDLRGKVAFVVNAQVEGFPENRLERTLVSLLKSGPDLIRFLLLLLGSATADSLEQAVDVTTGERLEPGGAWLFSESSALLEPMVRALSTEPRLLDDVHRLIEELKQSKAGELLLPTGWHEIWEPIWQARRALAPS